MSTHARVELVSSANRGCTKRLKSFEDMVYILKADKAESKDNVLIGEEVDQTSFDVNFGRM